MTLHRSANRWIAEAGPPAQPTGPAIDASGGRLHPPKSQTSGYDLDLRYAPNSADRGATFSVVYGRAPTPAEFLPYPTRYPITTTSVFYFDVTIAAPRPVTFSSGSTLDVWFPFVLDDALRYELFLDGSDRAIGPIASPVFDNTLHFVLPALTATPGKSLIGEIDAALS